MTLYFTQDHEWIAVEGDVATVGITDHAQDALGDVVFVEVPDPGRKVEQGKDASAMHERQRRSCQIASAVNGRGFSIKGQTRSTWSATVNRSVSPGDLKRSCTMRSKNRMRSS